MPRHQNQYGYWENVDRLPVRDCSCERCLRPGRHIIARNPANQSAVDQLSGWTPNNTGKENCTDCFGKPASGDCVECQGIGRKTGADGISTDFCLPCNGSGDCRVCQGTGKRPPTF